MLMKKRKFVMKKDDKKLWKTRKCELKKVCNKQENVWQ